MTELRDRGIEPRREPEPEREGTEPVGEPETLGPLRLQRHRKPDGRQLIIYARGDIGEAEA